MYAHELGLSNFPDEIDKFSAVFDLNAAQVAQARRLAELRAMPVLNAPQQAELASLVEALAPNIISPELMNHLSGSITALQTFFFEEVFDFILARQAEFNARVAQFRLIGEHNSSQSYLMHNLVHRPETGDLYKAIQDVPSGTPITNASFWVRLSERGAEGRPGVVINWAGDWHPDRTYVTHDGVRYNDILFFAIGNVPANTPPPNSQFWMQHDRFVVSKEEPAVQNGTVWVERM